MNNIVLVCDEKNIAENLKSELMLLRKLDFVFLCEMLQAENIISQNNPKLVIVYAKTGNENAIELLKNIKNIPILFVTDKIDDEYLLNIFEAGISDYITTSQSQTEFLIKVMQGLKLAGEINTAKRNIEILKQIGILKNSGDFYSQKYTSAVFKNIIKNCSSKNGQISLLTIAPDIEYKTILTLDFLAVLSKQNLRDDDVIGFGDDRLYILLPHTNKQGALEVYNKIKNNIKESGTISAGIIQIENGVEYDVISQKVDEALNDALMLKNSAVVQEELADIAAMNWLDSTNKKHKNFKLFKKAFLHKLELVVSPVFFQMQKMAEQRLFNVEIEQFCNENKSCFCLKKGDYECVFEITYPGAVKINIDRYDNVEENRTSNRQSFDLSQINEKMLSDMLEQFIRDFQKNDVD